MNASSQDLSRQFQQAAEQVSSLDPARVTPEMHTLYGLYKQATSGDHDTYQQEVGREEHDNPDGPTGLSQAQWEAWSQFKGLSREDAMRRYVQEARKLTNGDPAAASNQPSAEGWGTEAGAANQGLRGDLRSGAPYGSEEERKEDDDAQRGSQA